MLRFLFQEMVHRALNEHTNITDLHVVAHSMSDASVQAQELAMRPDFLPLPVTTLSLVAGFLTRTRRPDVAECLQKRKRKPKPSLKYPLGYLRDGMHSCSGPNKISFPAPTLTIGGSLDGVVRVTRIAEAFYTQSILDPANETNYPVVVVPGLNHASLLFPWNSSAEPPAFVLDHDLRAEISHKEAHETTARAITDFILVTTQKARASETELFGKLVPETSMQLSPIVDTFVRMEGNWFFTGSDDESGTSEWAAMAQQMMSEPLPKIWKWNKLNEFHMLTDEEKIPPYYRHKHRPSIQFDSYSGSITSTTVAQLRFIEIKPAEAAFGFNGYEIIKEEKVNVLHSLEDDGSTQVSAIEIAAKLASRELTFNRTGEKSSPSLDYGNRCKAINHRAYVWAQSTVSEKDAARFESYGVPLQMAEDKKPVIPAGPWWIYSYLEFQDDNNTGALNVTSIYAFYPLDANPYGAGNHYCKLLSPARAVEWILVDGLRAKYGLRRK